MFFTGNTIIIDHGLGLISIFAHLKDINVKLNQNIRKGQSIGSIGMTGRATGTTFALGNLSRKIRRSYGFYKQLILEVTKLNNSFSFSNLISRSAKLI